MPVSNPVTGPASDHAAASSSDGGHLDISRRRLLGTVGAAGAAGLVIGAAGGAGIAAAGSDGGSAPGAGGPQALTSVGATE
ncbi:hypothetical protein ACWGBV_20055, partial [Streptomyces sp. NPDC055051]